MRTMPLALIGRQPSSALINSHQPPSALVNPQLSVKLGPPPALKLSAPTLSPDSSTQRSALDPGNPRPSPLNTQHSALIPNPQPPATPHPPLPPVQEYADDCEAIPLPPPHPLCRRMQMIVRPSAEPWTWIPMTRSTSLRSTSPSSSTMTRPRA